ncbi:MAG: endonuclease/exonuclease/phosphatase family protein [Verrucomicrobia bacterium]|nr:endonuclease/exonuclease/phosphatase family protein [Verrucomicrobiota bacterium]
METVTSSSDDPWIPSKPEFFRDNLAPKFSRLASFLTTPGCWGSSMILRIISPMNQPGNYDFYATKTREYALRAFYAAALFPVAGVGLLLGFHGLYIRLIGQLFQQKAFSYAQSQAKEKTFNGSATILTWNICGMAGGLSRPFGGMVEWSKRIDGITDKVLKTDADVVCLQEVLDAELDIQLRDKFKEKYKHIYYLIGGSSYRLSSGLFIASKFPIGNFTFTPFSTQGTGQFKMHYKGFVSGVFQGNGKELSFVATHTCAGSPEASAEIRQKQVQQMIDSTKKTTIYVGDFNVNQLGKEWASSPLRTLKRDTNFKEATATDLYKCQMFDNDLNIPLDEKLDDVFSNKNIQLKTLLVNADKLSDHHPILSTVTV